MGKRIKLKHFADIDAVANYVRMEILATLEDDARNNPDMRKEMHKKMHDIDKVWPLLSAAPELLKQLTSMRTKYGRLHDIVSDCIEGGRIDEGVLPDDYKALVRAVLVCVGEESAADKLIARVSS